MQIKAIIANEVNRLQISSPLVPVSTLDEPNVLNLRIIQQLYLNALTSPDASDSTASPIAARYTGASRPHSPPSRIPSAFAQLPLSLVIPLMACPAAGKCRTTKVEEGHAVAPGRRSNFDLSVGNTCCIPVRNGLLPEEPCCGTVPEMLVVVVITESHESISPVDQHPRRRYQLLKAFQFTTPCEVSTTNVVNRVLPVNTSSLPQSHCPGNRPTTLVQLEDLQHAVPIGSTPNLPGSEHHRQGVILVHVTEIVNELLEARAMPFDLTPSEAVDSGHVDVVV